MILFYERLKKADADRLLEKVRVFMDEHPKRRVITVGLGADRAIKVRRGREVEDIQKVAVLEWRNKKANAPGEGARSPRGPAGRRRLAQRE